MTPASILLGWYKRYGRDLPWRKTHDPYRLLVSEMMLQQTQVSRVLFFYERWLRQFPSWHTLAKAENAEIIHAWAGLGYNRRGLMLRDIARQVIDQGVPQTQEAWQGLKGIGPYTAAALAAFSLKQRTLPIDTNIRRTVGRILLGLPFPQPEQDEKIQEVKDALLPKQGNYFDIPQALFDLATMVCTKSPQCRICPMKKTCKAAPQFLSGTVEIPKRMGKKTHENKHRNKPSPDRIYRGRILKLIRESKEGVNVEKIGPLVDPLYEKKFDQAWVQGLVERLIKDQFLKRQGNVLLLF